MRKEFRNLIDPEKFRDLVNNFSLPRKTESVQLGSALGRVTAEDVYARSDVPPFSRSLMDGYAVVASDTYGADEENPKRLSIGGEVKIGEQSSQVVTEGEAVEIPTGAGIPAGANSVVMVEDTELDGDDLLVKSSVVPGENVLSAGTDIATGDLIIREGKELTPLEIAKLAASGLEAVEVERPPEVGIISTGPELVSPGGELPEAMIYDVNSSLLIAGVREAGGQPHGMGLRRIKEEGHTVGDAHHEHQARRIGDQGVRSFQRLAAVLCRGDGHTGAVHLLCTDHIPGLYAQRGIDRAVIGLHMPGIIPHAVSHVQAGKGALAVAAVTVE